jgi:hypothetical protein
MVKLLFRYHLRVAAEIDMQPQLPTKQKRRYTYRIPGKILYGGCSVSIYFDFLDGKGLINNKVWSFKHRKLAMFTYQPLCIQNRGNQLEISRPRNKSINLPFMGLSIVASRYIPMICIIHVVVIKFQCRFISIDWVPIDDLVSLHGEP